MESIRGSRALAYLRVSVVGDRRIKGTLESPEIQRGHIDAWAADRGVTIVDEVRDLNRSGATLTRPGLERCVAMVRSGAVDGIVVWKSDRASRSVLGGLGLIDTLAGMGGWIVATDGTLDTTTPTAKLATTMFLAMSENQIENFRVQSRDIHRKAILEKGRHMGPAPFGYHRSQDGRLAIDADQAAVVRWVFERRSDGAGWTAIARELHTRGVRQRNGRALNPHMLRRMVANRTYLGEARHGKHLKIGAHPAIVDEALFLAATRAAPSVRPAHSVVRVHEESLLRGLVRCGSCRYACKRQPQRPGFTWSCRTLVSERTATHDCEAPIRVRARDEPDMERIVVAAFKDLVSGRAVERGESMPDVAGIERRLSDAEALLDEMSSLEIRRQLGAERWGAVVQEARQSVDRAREELTTARMRLRSAAITDRATVDDAWDGMTFSERQDALRSIVKAVMVVGDGPIGERVHVVPVWEPLDLPGAGRSGLEFVARPWVPGGG